jgi:hypothetical protein
MDEVVSHSPGPDTDKLSPLYESEEERNLHRNEIRIVAERAGFSEDEVRKLYEIVLRRLKGDARIKEFLPLLTGRRVEYLLNLRNARRKSTER